MVVIMLYVALLKKESLQSSESDTLSVSLPYWLVYEIMVLLNMHKITFKACMYSYIVSSGALGLI